MNFINKSLFKVVNNKYDQMFLFIGSIWSKIEYSCCFFQVTPGSVAAKGGLASGDVILVVNGEAVAEMTQDECEAKVKQAVGSLYLVLEK